jgi:hypothetical protein
MGTYNVLHATLLCPRCGAPVDTEVECHFGYTAEMQSLRLGDRYPSGKATNAKALDGDSYMECQLCGKDSHLLVQVREGIIVGVVPNFHKAPYISG